MPAGPAREALRELLALGYTWSQISDKAGVLNHVIQALLAEVSDELLGENAAALLALTPSMLGEPVGLVDAALTHQRVRSLMALGWTSRWIASQVWGENSRGWHFYIGRVTCATASTILGLYQSVSDREGPSEHGRHLAARKGWPKPIDWDDPESLAWPAQPAELSAGQVDGSNDDVVDDVKIERTLDGDSASDRLTVAERVVAVRRLRDRGHSDAEIGDYLGVSGRTVLRIRQDHDIAAAETSRLLPSTALAADLADTA